MGFFRTGRSDVSAARRRIRFGVKEIVCGQNLITIAASYNDIARVKGLLGIFLSDLRIGIKIQILNGDIGGVFGVFLNDFVCLIVIGVVWEWIFDPNIGLLNHILHLHINWLYDTHFAMPALIIVSVWKLIGYNMVIFLSSLSGISQSMFEAAKIDGATPFQTFKNVTIPLLSPSIFFVVIITAISSFQVFDLIYLILV